MQKEHRIARLLLGLGLLAATARADTIVVPDDQPDLEAAIAAASPGDEIVVRTAADQNVSGQLTVDKSLTIVGDPVCNLSIQDWGIRLEGSGADELALVNTSVGYPTSLSNGAPLLFGGGFAAVRLFGCSLRHDNFPVIGILTASHPAIDLPGVLELTLVESDVLGGRAGADFCVSDPDVSYVDGRAGVLAPAASVLLVDSEVRGGSGGFGQTTSRPCPTDLSDWGGAGGDGVVAAEVHAWNSQVTGGLGCSWSSHDPLPCDAGSPVLCGFQPDGDPFVVSGILTDNACSRLTQASSRLPLGGTWSPRWDPFAPGCLPTGSGFCLWYVSFDHPIDPIPLGSGYAFLDPAAATFLASFPFDLAVTLDLRVPAALGLVGLALSSQVMTTTGALSGPTSAIIVP